MPGINKAVHFALTTTEFDDLVAALRGTETAFSNWVGEPEAITIRADGTRQIYLQDPDGYWIEVNSTASD